jgi:hypothetical protein
MDLDDGHGNSPGLSLGCEQASERPKGNEVDWNEVDPHQTVAEVRQDIKRRAGFHHRRAP